MLGPRNFSWISPGGSYLLNDGPLIKFKICNYEAHAIGWGDLGLKLDDRSLRYEVLSEDEWKAKLNEFLEQS